MTLSLRAPAKLNLYLAITGKRSDGYHTLQTVFALVDWYDDVTLSCLPTGEIRRDQAIAGVPESDDLSLRAARLLRAHTGCALGVCVTVAKSIPMGAGLGGGSSDAASVLLGLNQLWGLDLPRSLLAQIGLQLGADVPVFVGEQHAYATGVGEQLVPLALPSQRYAVLFPGVAMPTAAAFADPDLPRDAAPLAASQWRAAPRYENAFQVVVAKHPDIARAMRFLREVAGAAHVSGSGSALFCPVDTLWQAPALPDSRWILRTVHTLSTAAP